MVKLVKDDVSGYFKKGLEDLMKVSFLGLSILWLSLRVALFRAIASSRPTWTTRRLRLTPTPSTRLAR